MVTRKRAPATTSRRRPVAILGATGTVGQRFVQLLEHHPWFEVAEVMASDQSAGKSYAEAIGSRWKLPTSIPASVAKLKADYLALLSLAYCQPGTPRISGK